MADILLVDDETAIRRGFRALLEGEGYTVRTARSPDDALAKIAEARPDLILLDVMLPGRNGFTLCSEIRRIDKLVPILMLTALNDEGSRLRGFDAGADDFITKTASDAELLARIRRTIERTKNYERLSPSDTAQIGRLTIDFVKHRIFDGDREIERLTLTETDLLRLFTANRTRYFTLGEIADVLCGQGYSIEEVTLRVHICHLKAKLHEAGNLLVNERKAGYVLLS